MNEDNMEIIYNKQAESYLDKQTVKQVDRIKNAVNNLPFGDVKKLRTIKNGYRLRVGTVRILFIKNGNNLTVIKIDNRGDIYK